MYHAISHDCFMNIAGFGVRDSKRIVVAVLVCLHYQLTIKSYKVVGEPHLKLSDVGATPLSLEKSLPRRKKRFQSYTLIVVYFIFLHG